MVGMVSMRIVFLTTRGESTSSLFWTMSRRLVIYCSISNISSWSYGMDSFGMAPSSVSLIGNKGIPIDGINDEISYATT